jgi:D-amino-acid dehydrogenase
MTVLRWMASRCAVVTRLKPHSHQATIDCRSTGKSFSRDSRSNCDRLKRVRATVLAESTSWRNSRLLAEHGRHQEVLDFGQITALEPALGHGHIRFAGAIHDTSDGTGDPQQFALGLAAVCRRLGATFHLGTSVTRLDTDGSSVTRIITSDGPIHPDAVVLAAGSASPLLTRTMGHHIPVYPAKGYTLTTTIKDPDRAPRIGGIDERSLVAWSRFGGELRMSATAEFVGYDRSSTPADYADIIDTGNQLFPGAIDWDIARYRTGLRPMTPDGPPLIGLGRHDNLYYNTGHGHVVGPWRVARRACSPT